MIYRFGPYTLNAATRQLLRHGDEIHVSPKAYDLLLVLVANRQRAVSKHELQQQLWPTTFVEETNLATLVAEIRRGLGDAAKSPTFIRTVYGFGYRFVANVTEAHAPRRISGARMRPFLVLEGRHVALVDDETVIGRAEDATIRIDSAGVSRRHARIVVVETGATVEDLGSKNGTYVHGEPLSAPRPLSDGDEIRVGPVSPDITRRHFVTTVSAGLAATAARPAFGQAPTMLTRRTVRPVVISDLSGAKFRNGGTQNCVEKAFSMIAGGGDVLDSLIAGVNIPELDPEETGIGYGGLAGIEGVRTPSLVARAVMEHTDHHLLVGKGAQDFARAMGFTIESDLNTEKSRRLWLEWKRRSDPEHDLDPGERHGDARFRSASSRNAHRMISCNVRNQQLRASARAVRIAPSLARLLLSTGGCDDQPGKGTLARPCSGGARRRDVPAGGDARKIGARRPLARRPLGRGRSNGTR